MDDIFHFKDILTWLFNITIAVGAWFMRELYGKVKANEEALTEFKDHAAATFATKNDIAEMKSDLKDIKADVRQIYNSLTRN